MIIPEKNYKNERGKRTNGFLSYIDKRVLVQSTFHHSDKVVLQNQSRDNHDHNDTGRRHHIAVNLRQGSHGKDVSEEDTSQLKNYG